MMKIQKVRSQEEGVDVAKKVLYSICNKDTLLFLSGGKTPKSLYEQLAKEKKLKVGAVAMVDERYGEPFHETSNELMIEKTGFLNFLSSQNIPFYSVLENKRTRVETAKDYDQLLEHLLQSFHNKIGILGIGSDGHTAGLPVGIKNSELRMRNDALVAEFDDFPGPQKERITMTFKAISEFTSILVLVFGEDKKEALKEMFTRKSEEEIPARFYTRAEISQKTLLITDQKV